ncbi:hypothetical protein SAMD00023353_1400780 [Rosellinia necatrix]|uniref:Uncharacterized protein n=1 Tax=Rosellinia necatrix TaxID=77044 RepID=A0A1W2TCU5_ROSNE|nr:hypothetical protein SAMD00023353_1400780 [Rosellinia necatrix]
MRFSACLRSATAVAVIASPVVALVIGEDGGFAKTTPVIRDAGCNKDAIDACVASTGQTNSACFGHLCADKPINAVAKRQSECTEENLLQCAILDWNEAQACFQQLCL